MPLPLADIFPDEDYRFHLTLRQGSAAEFFRGSDERILGERRRWIAATPGRYVQAAASADADVAALESALTAWIGRTAAADGAASARLERIGGEVEADIVLLADRAGTKRLTAGVVCFPSSWALKDKVGQPMNEIHAPVPTLNHSLGTGIERFLERLRPGVAFERANWGLAATPELNMHPALHRPRLSGTTAPESIWVRIEDQLLTPVDGIVVFGIRVRVLPLAAVLSDHAAAAGLRRGLRTMPSEVAAYKGIAAAREALLRL